MPFTKGKATPGAGRKGFQFERDQLERMTKLLNRYLTLAETIESGKSNENQEKAFDSLKALILKIMDKLHANKVAIEGDKDNPISIIIKNFKNADTD